MLFSTKVKGVACKCRVAIHNPFTFTLVGKSETESRLLNDMVDEEVANQMAEEYQLERMYEYHHPY